jgi:putative nucleotidyltransferase with HDIG domain
MRTSLRNKIIVPFVLLLAFVGILGTGIAAQRLAGAASSAFDEELFHAGVLAADELARLEATRLTELRAATDTIGVADALKANDGRRLGQLLLPVAANENNARIKLLVLDGRATTLVEIAGARLLTSPTPLAFATFEQVQGVLLGETDRRGDRNAFLASTPSPTVYWVGPVRDDTGAVVGAALVGETLADVAAEVPNTVFYAADGQVLASSAPVAPLLSRAIRDSVLSDRPSRVIGPISGHDYGQLFSDWLVRDRFFGYFAVILDAQTLVASLNQSRLLLVAVFTIAAILVMVIGSALAVHITRPLEDLVDAMRAVSRGNLAVRAVARSRDEVGFLAGTFNQMAASLQEKSRILEDTAFASMKAFARAIDARDPYTYGHSARVAAISLEIADTMALPRDERQALERAALLHDIGKIGVADRILRKHGPLSRSETTNMHQHPVIGYEMLRGLPFLTPSLLGIRHHHERWDGKGYPDRLAGDAIPAYVRILSVADVFDALTSDRPYRRGLPLPEAAAAIKRGAGKSFDPEVVAAFQSRFDAIRAIVTGMGKERTLGHAKVPAGRARPRLPVRVRSVRKKRVVRKAA